MTMLSSPHSPFSRFQVRHLYSLWALWITLSAFCLAAPAAAQTDLNKLERSERLLIEKDGASAVLTSGDILYIASDNNGLYTFDLKDKFKPAALKVAYKELGIPTGGILKKGNFLFVSDNLKGVVIFDVADASNPKVAASFKTASNEAWDLAFDDTQKYLFVAAGKSGVEVWNIGSPTQPTRVAETTTLAEWDYAWSVFYTDKTLYVSDRKNGARILDASNPASLSLKSTYKVSGELRYAVARDTMMFLAKSRLGFEAVNLKRMRPAFTESYTQGSYAYGFAFYPLNPNFLFVGAGNAGLHVYETPKFANDDPKSDKSDKSTSEYRRIAASGHALYVATSKGVMLYEYDLTPLLTNVQALTTDEQKPLKYTFTGIDPDGDSTTISLVPTGKNPDSLLYQQPSRTLTWTPSFEQSGNYDFTVRIGEKASFQLSSTKSLRVTVKHVNRKPTQPAPKDQLINENDTLRYTIPEGTDPDKEDAGRLTYAAQNLPKGSSFNGPSRTFTWKPDYTQAGDYKVKFVVSDANTDGRGVLSDSKEINVRVDNVNLTPALDSVAAQTFFENKAQSFTVKASDPDKEDDGKLIYSIVAPLPAGAAFDAQKRELSWTPTYEQSGEYKVTFEVRDQGLNPKLLPDAKLIKKTSITVPITVKPTNRPPVIAAIPAQKATENKPLTFAVTAADPDKEDAGKLSFSAVKLPEGATFDSSKRAFAWTPTFEQSGDHIATFKVVDTGIDGTALSDTESVSISVANVNRKPTMEKVADASGTEDSTLTFTLTLADPDKQDAGKLKVTSAPELPKGASLKSDDKSATVTWKPDFEQAGSYKLTYTITDAEGLSEKQSHTITIANKNRAPRLAKVGDKVYTKLEDIKIVLAGSDDDSQDAPDKNGRDRLKYAADGVPTGAKFDAASKTFSWKPVNKDNGDYPITFRVTDNSGASVEEKIKLSIDINRAPALDAIGDKSGDEDAAIEFTVKTSDPDKRDEGKVKTTAEPLPTGATFDGAKFSWKPTFDQAGSYKLTFKATDSEGLSDSKPVTITVKNKNRNPILSGLQDAYSVEEKADLKITVEAKDDDKEDAAKLTVSADGVPTGAKFDAKSRTLSWKPDFGQKGDYKITFKAKDASGGESSKDISVKVGKVNRKPALAKLKPATVPAGGDLNLTIAATDPDGDKLTFSAAGLPTGATLSESGALAYKAADDDAGKSFTVDITVKDDGGLEDKQTLKITVGKKKK